MIRLPRDFKELLKLLNAHGVEYLKQNKKAAGRHKDVDDLENLENLA